MNDLLCFPIVSVTEDDLGQKEEIEEFSRQAFCEKKSISQNEFFQAGQSGIKASVVLNVHMFDYLGETKLKFRGKIYHIYRTYERADEKIELYCEVKSGG